MDHNVEHKKVGKSICIPNFVHLPPKKGKL